MPNSVIVEDASSISGGGATLIGYVQEPGTVSAVGFFWTTEHDNPNSTDHVLTSTLSGDGWSGVLSGLYFGALVHYRGWVQDSVDGLVLSDVKSFRTLSVPSLQTTLPVADGATGVKCGGKFNFGGGSSITARSLLAAIGRKPTIADYDIKVDAVPGTGLPDDFDVTMSGMTEGAIYQLRARALNGTGNGYGQVQLFRAGVGVSKRRRGRDTGLGIGSGMA